MKNIPIWIRVLAVLALLIVAKFLFFSKKNMGSAATSKDKNSLPVSVHYHVVTTGSISNEVFASGKIGALNQIDILPEVSGKVTGIFFEEGEPVKKGALLVKLNDADLQAQILKNRTQLKLSEQKLNRLKKLLAINGISQEEHDAQENELLALKADEAFLMAEIAKTAIVAPFDGVVGLKNISEGSFVNILTPIVSLVQLKPLYVEFSIPEKYSALFHKGESIKFSPGASQGDNNYSASIYAIEPRVEEATKTLRARAMYKGNQVFYPGSFVKVFVNLETTQNAIMVPTQAIVATLKGQKVFVNRLGAAVEIPVTIGVRTDRQIQVLEGLRAGDTVLTSGLLSVRKDSKLKLIAAQK